MYVVVSLFKLKTLLNVKSFADGYYNNNYDIILFYRF